MAEAKIAKNYMPEDELRRLYLISEQFLSFAELKMSSKTKMLMKDWQEKLDEMLKLNDLKILIGKGKVSRSIMEKKVRTEMTYYRSNQPPKQLPKG